MNYRHVPAGSEQDPQAEDDAEDADDVRNWASLDDSNMRRSRRPHPLGKEANVIYDDARPYASTNVIHQTSPQRNNVTLLTETEAWKPASNHGLLFLFRRRF